MSREPRQSPGLGSIRADAGGLRDVVPILVRSHRFVVALILAQLAYWPSDWPER